jgi:hypothetical protein
MPQSGEKYLCCFRENLILFPDDVQSGFQLKFQWFEGKDAVGVGIDD